MENRYSVIDEEKIYVPDTSVIINGCLVTLLKDSIEKYSKLIIHAAMISELEHQANSGNEMGYRGLTQLQEIQKIAKSREISITYEGRRPNISEIKRAGSGEIDAIIRDHAWKIAGTLITSDRVQYLGAQAIGMDSIFVLPERSKKEKKLLLEDFFDKETMSIHVKQGAPVYVKKGRPGKVSYQEFSNKKLSREEVIQLSDEIITKAKQFEDTFIEIDRSGSTIVQYANMRIVICRPPFSDGWEITAVRPLVKLDLEDYITTPNLYNRLKEKAEGILIAGSPGTGKTTFARALALFYEKQSKVIKTIESPRDLDLKAEITQYSKNFGTRSEIHDILLLSRPDYTVFDEIRDTEDFKLYTDLRLSGIGLIGVIHSSTAIDAVQRFIGRLELGVIPSVLDTIIYMEDGRISQILDVKMTVKVPTGLVENDLARPVVEVRNFDTYEVVYEMYTFGEQTVVIPIKDIKESDISVDARTLRHLTEAIEQYSNEPIMLIPKDRQGRRFEIQCARRDIPLILGKGGENIKRLENLFKVKLDVNKSGDFSSSDFTGKTPLNTSMVSFRKRSVIISFPKHLKDANIEFLYQNSDSQELEFLFTGTVSRSGNIKLSTKSEAGKIISESLSDKEQIIFWKII
ncbi:ATPase, T2SS/T4P/T4SS family [Candidatus Hodarchaeum mangrovi]